MNEKTEELRDIFMDVTEEETVTESQEELRGSVTEGGQSAESVVPVIEEMREKFTFETDLADDTLESVVRSFYDDHDDSEIGTELSCSATTVFEARMDLHLVRDEDPPGVEADEQVWETIRDTSEADVSTLAADLGLDETAVDRLQAVVRARNRSRRVSHRFRTAFEERLTDIDLKHQLAADTHRDGLDDATEDAEVDVDF